MIGDLDSRMIGITLDELKALPNRLCVAGGPEKIQALRAALRGGYITHLVTDADAAEALLALSGLTALTNVAISVSFVQSRRERAARTGRSWHGGQTAGRHHRRKFGPGGGGGAALFPPPGIRCC